MNKYNQKMRIIKKLLLPAVAIGCLYSCDAGTDDMVPGQNKPVGYKFDLVVSKMKDSDHADIVNTVCSYTDNLGQKVDTVYNEKAMKSLIIQSPIYTDLPDTLLVTVNETLKPGLTLDKESYQVGIGISFSVSTVDNKGNVFGSIASQKNIDAIVDKDDLERYYPQTTEFKYVIDTDGKITVL